MNKPLCCLLAEDSENDALLLVRQLRMGGYDVTWERVDTAEAMRAALGRQPWDIVIADYEMPRFSGLAALELLKASGKGLPFIIVSGSIGEEEAVASMKAGAHDYIVKGKLARLVPAVERELREAVEWRARQRAEVALQESEEQYRKLFEGALDAIIVASAETGTIIDCNRAATLLWGREKSELVGQHQRMLHPPEETEGGVSSTFQQHLRGKEGQILEAQIVTKTGGIRDVEIMANTFELGGQRLIQGIFRDITERKRAEEALRASKQRFQAVFEQAAVGVVIAEGGRGRFVNVNRRFCEIVGYSAEELLQRTSHDITHPDDIPNDTAQLEQIKAGIVQESSWEKRYRRKDGTIVWARVSVAPLDPSEANPTLRIGVIADITERKQAEEALKREQALFTDLVSTIPDQIYFKDRQSRFIRINDAVAKRFGLRSPDEAVGKTDFDVFSEEHARQAYEDEQRIMSTGDPLIGLVEKETWPDGHVTWDSSTKVPLRDADGNITGLVGISRDITEHKRDEDGVRMSASLLRATLESTADGIMVVDMNSKVLDFNQQFGEMWRLPESVLATHQDQKLLDYVMEQLADPEGFLAGVRALYAQPAKESFDTLQFKDGRVFERFSRPQRIEDQIVGRVWSFRDVTERMQAETHNREQAALLDKANDAIYVRALDHTILYWNKGAERTYGWTSAEVLNRKTTEFISLDVAATEALTAILLKQESWSGERWQMTKDGRKVEVFSRLTLVRNEQGQPQSVFAINTDITGKKQLEAQFLRAQRLESIGALASGIAHDLNNVLAPIVLGAPLLREMITDQAARHLLTTMETSAQRGAAIVKQVLTFARGVEGERVPLQPRHLLREMEKLADETFPKGIRVESDIAADLWQVLGDATQLHQALMNLCINARDAMPGGGVLTLEGANLVLAREAAEKIPGAQPGSYACLRVTDTGKGIPPEIEEKIFEPFFTTKGLGKGTGLGLSTVLGIVRSHGGFVRVASKVGQGSTFELYLPATTEQVAVKSDSATPWPHTHGEGILVVDDEAAVCEVTRAALMEFGYQVITAARGAEALTIFQERRREIQLVLTDMMMPEMDGPTLVAALRVLDPAVRIVGITGMSDTAGMSGLKTLALSAMLAKPFTIKKLLAVIREALPVTAGQERAVPEGGESRPAPPG